MCGIVGFFSTSGKFAQDVSDLKSMGDVLSHRGPDDQGEFFHRDDRLSVGFGHRRLSIIDTSSLGAQPMHLSERGLSICYNGEIYNYQELKKDLVKRGAVFESNCDTEVLLKGIAYWGLRACLERVRGMYAFALFDMEKGTLSLVRDCIGIKPLYFHWKDGALHFASEIKALFAIASIEPNLCEESLPRYLSFAYVPRPQTLFSKVQKLSPGTILEINSKGTLSEHQFWDIRKFGNSNSIPETEAIERIDELFRQAVQRRCVSDVPIGAYLSGGIDSSLCVALMTEFTGGPVRTFSVGLKDDPNSELNYAKNVSNLFQTKHTELILDESDFIDSLEKISYHLDEPIADPVSVPLLHLAECTRKNGTVVVQVGEGSDELFAGYRTFHQFNSLGTTLFEPYASLPKALKSIAYTLGRETLPPYLSDALYRAKERLPFFLSNAVAFWDTEVQHLLKNIKESDGAAPYVKQEIEKITQSGLKRMILLEMRNRLPEMLLMRVDKMTMAHSIEARVPFLDQDLVEFSMSLPSSLLFKGGNTKYVLKKVAEKYLPREIIYRKKWGFLGSASSMVTPKVFGYAKERVLDSSIVRELFDVSAIEKLFSDPNSRARQRHFKIWNLLSLVLWHSSYIKNQLAARSAA